jgi:hypothetical protein
LGYLLQTYGFEAICAEGFSERLPLPQKTGTVLTRRAIARSELESRQISAVEYIAMTYPSIQVIGVENMAYYAEHMKCIQSETPEEREWSNNLGVFLDDVIKKVN